MTKAQFDHFIDLLPEETKKQFQGPQRHRMGEQLAQVTAMEQEALRRGIDKLPETQQLIRLQAQNVLASVLYAQISAEVKRDEVALRYYYDTHTADFELSTTRHILVRVKGAPRVPVRAGQKELTDEEALARAKELRERLVKGEDFAALAKAESDDTTSGAKGGELGDLSRSSQIVPEFLKTAFALKVNEISDPVKTMYGYHLIQVTKRSMQTFETARPFIEKKLPEQMLAEIKEKANIKLDEGYFGK